MTLSELKQLVKRRPDARAAIISDGCRDYVVEIHQQHGAGLLQDRKRRPMRFRSLAEATTAIKRARVGRITLKTRIAADEACAGATVAHPGFDELPLTSSLPR